MEWGVLTGQVAISCITMQRLNGKQKKQTLSSEVHSELTWSLLIFVVLQNNRYKHIHKQRVSDKQLEIMFKFYEKEGFQVYVISRRSS